MVEALLRFAGRLWDVARTSWGRLCELLRRLLDRLRGLLRAADGLASGTELSLEPLLVGSAVVTGPKPAEQALPKASPIASPSASPRISHSAEDASDETALARMLASGDPRVSVKTGLGWLTIQQAHARKQTIHELLTQGLGYGPQERRGKGQIPMLASTAKAPTKEDRSLARLLLSGGVLPSFAIQEHQPGRWALRGAELSDEKLLEKQNGWHQGIYGRIAGTNWYLFSSDVAKRVAKSGQTAKQVLDSVPEVVGMDSVISER